MGNLIRPYGGVNNDGRIQVSFTLPCSKSSSSRQLAITIAKRMGLTDVLIVQEKGLSDKLVFYILYGSLEESFCLEKVPEVKNFSVAEIKQSLNNLKKSLVVIGATTGTDAHTVGLDAIMNMKGIKGHKGLESYPNIHCINLGSQVPNSFLLEKAVYEQADAILVSQTVTQNNCHILNLKELFKLLEQSFPQFIDKVYIGGARITNKLAKDLGFKRGFGSNTMPEEVLTQILLDNNLLGG